MDPAKIEAWQRFREQVLHNPGWPRELWFAALEDGLQAALGDDSRLLADYRRDRAELLLLERRASGAYQDEQRIGQLEAQIRQLAELADRTMTGPEPAAGTPESVRPAASAPAPARRHRWVTRALALASGALLLALGAAGASVYHETRAMSADEQQMARIDRLLDEHAASLRAELDRRLAAERGGTDGAAGELADRGAAVGRALDQVSLDVSSLEMRLPALARELETIAAGAGQMAHDLARTRAEVDALQATTPELAAWLAHEREELEQAAQNRRQSLAGIDDRVQQLTAEVDRSQVLLTDLNQSLVEGLQQAALNGEALRNAVDEMRAAGLEVAELMDGAERKVQLAQAAMQAKIEQMLSGLAEQADLALLRGADVLSRAEGEIARRAEAASATALDAVGKQRAAQLAALTEQVAASQAELDQTQAALLAGWQRMDQSVAERQQAVLADLDTYAGTIGMRVEELLQALDVIVARSGG